MDKYLKIFYNQNRKDKNKLILIVFGTILVSIFEVAGIVSIGPFIGIVSNSQIVFENKYLFFIYNYFSFEEINSFLIFFGFVSLSVIIIANLLSTLMLMVSINFSNLLGHKLSLKLLDLYLYQSYNFFLKRNSSDLSKNILTEVGRVVGGIYLPSIILISKIVVSIFIIISLMFVNIYVSLILASIFGFSYLLIFYFFKKKLEYIGEINSNAIYEKFKIVNESLSSFKLLKIHKLENFFLESFKKSSKNFSKTNAKSLIISQSPRYLIETIAISSVILIIISFLKIDSAYGIIPLMAIYAFAGLRLLPSFQEIYRSINLIKYHYPAYEKILKDLNLNNTLFENKHESQKIKDFESINFCNVSFKYENQENLILDKINLKIQSKKTVGIIGKTGAGKTTLIDLFIGLLDPISGEILIDKHSLKENRHSWHNIIGYVPQFPTIIDGTIISNIAYGKHNSEIDKDLIYEVIEAAGLQSLIKSLSNGLDTQVGERGVKLSGGQIQRIALARALYKKPKCLILDEATSSLDINTESKIVDSINNLSTKITVVIIAHRYDTIKNCDEIFELESGKIVNTYGKSEFQNKYLNNNSK
tara:strand:+ start:8499 stop:10265 length:1767 start_codon:yes stop_codon:yes gene_type:complete